MNDILLVAAIVAFIGAVLGLVLVRGSDFVTYGQGARSPSLSPSRREPRSRLIRGKPGALRRGAAARASALQPGGVADDEAVQVGLVGRPA